MSCRISKEKDDSIKDWLNSWAQSGALPGVMLGIYNENNEEIFFHSVNSPYVHSAARETPLPYTRDAIFRTYSMTKPVTSVAIMILHERELLSIYDEVKQYLPEFTNIKVIIGGDSIDNYTTEPLQAPLTIFHLLTHTSGITYGICGKTVADQLLLKNFASLPPFATSSEFSACVAMTPLAFQPGTQFQYGCNFEILGRIIEVACGKSLEELFQIEIFQPLGMIDTTFIPREKRHRVLEIYDIAPGQNCKQNVHFDRRDFSPKKIFQSAGGGLFSTISDYSKFANCMLHYGMILCNSSDGKQKRLLKEETVKLMTQNLLPDSKDITDIAFDQGFITALGTSGHGFGLGFSILQDPSKAVGSSPEMVGTFGWVGIAGTIVAIDPMKKVVALFITQIMNSLETYPIQQQLRFYIRSISN